MTTRGFFKMAALVLGMAFITPSQSIAANKVPVDSAANARMLSDIVSRVTEIQNMDKSNLTVSEKKELKKELKDMKRKADTLDRRVYLSVGAIIIIILLLILIL